MHLEQSPIRETVGEDLPVEVSSGHRDHTRYLNRKYFIDRTVSHQRNRKGKRRTRKYHGGAPAESSHLGLREHSQQVAMIKSQRLGGGAQGDETQTSKEAMPAGNAGVSEGM